MAVARVGTGLWVIAILVIGVERIMKRFLCLIWRHKWDWESHLRDPEAKLRCVRCKKVARVERGKIVVNDEKCNKLGRTVVGPGDYRDPKYSCVKAAGHWPDDEWHQDQFGNQWNYDD